MVDGRMLDHGYTISSPCEPNGLGELIKLVLWFQTYELPLYVC